MEEIWKQIYIDNIPTNYEISNLGRCRHTKKLHWKSKGILKPKHHKKNGYDRYTIVCQGVNKCYYIHRLVAEYFIPNPDNKEQVNHIDGNKTNNKASNLEWVTPKENMEHCFKNNLCSNAKPVKVYRLNGEYVGKYYSISEACRVLNIGGWTTDFYKQNKNTGGYQIRLENDPLPINDISKSCIYGKRKVVQLSLSGEFIAEYNSLAEAYRTIEEIDNGCISQACLGRRENAYGYKWVYSEEYYK